MVDDGATGRLRASSCSSRVRAVAGADGRQRPRARRTSRAGTWTGADGADAAGATSFGRAEAVADVAPTCSASVQSGGDALVRLNDAFMPDGVFVDVPAGLTVERPVLVVHWCEPGARRFPRTCVRAGEGAVVSVVEVFAGADGTARSLVVPVTELAAADHASVSYVSLQVLPDSGLVHRPPPPAAAGPRRLRTFTVGLGGAYDRVRTDVTVDGRGRPQRDPVDLSR